MKQKYNYLMSLTLIVCQFITFQAKASSIECDGIYVAVGADDWTTATPNDPTSLLTGLSMAASNSGAVVKIATGTYFIDDPILISGNMTLEGGFDAQNNWIKTSEVGATTIYRTAANPEGGTIAPRIVAIYSVNGDNFKIHDITIETADATQNRMSTYGLHLTNCTNYYFTRVQVLAGDAGQGVNGQSGANGAAGFTGANGLNGDEDDQAYPGHGGAGGRGGGTGYGNGGAGGFDSNGSGCCAAGPAGVTGSSSSNYRAGGGGGGGGCGGEEDQSGGTGGKGGGVNGSLTGPNGGNGGGGGDPGSGGAAGLSGINGTSGNNGSNGSSGIYQGGFWVPGGNGTNGTDGKGGTGGSGGGGGGGQSCFFCTDGAGNGGGAGGGGGEGGAAGTGGTAAGSSFGIFLNNNGFNGNFVQCNVLAGTAGIGGTGGNGGSGGTGGNGGVGASFDTAEIGRGGNGGKGGNGGAGGRGGNGADGVAVALFLNSGGVALNTDDYNANLAGQPTIYVDAATCTYQDVVFTSEVEGAWEFDDGANNAFGTTATIQYDNAGRQTVIFDGVTYTDFVNIPLEGNLAPSIFGNGNTPIANTFFVCEGESASFSTTATADNYYWDFGGAMPNPTNTPNVASTTFNTAGTYNVSLYINTTCCGDSPLKTFVLQVDALPVASINAIDEVCLGDGLQQLSAVPNGGFWGGSANAFGQIDPAALGVGTHTVIYDYTNANGCSTSTTLNVMVANDCFVTVQVQALLQAPYNATTSTMGSLLGTVAPAAQPFSSAPWNYQGTETLTGSIAGSVDWVLLEMLDVSGTTIVEQKAAILLSDGNIVDVDGVTAGVKFNNLVNNNGYRVIVRPRGHLAVASANAVAVINDVMTYDFTLSSLKASGANQMLDVGGGNYALKAGDFDADGDIDTDDYNIYLSESSLLNDYYSSDCNFDKTVSVADFNWFLQNNGTVGVSMVAYP